MSEAEFDTRFEEADVYETPVLAEAGGYQETTQGFLGWWWDGTVGFGQG
jgi:hypothetical protein